MLSEHYNKFNFSSINKMQLVETNIDVLGNLTLERIWEESWSMLVAAVKDRKSPMHTPALATVGEEGANVRVVVLRNAIPEERQICCHTDLRSGKIADVKRNPNVSWLFYDAEKKVQLRLSGIAAIHTDDALADARWATTKLMSRRCYATTLPPGTQSDEPTSGLPDFLVERNPTAEESEAGRENFAVVQCNIDRLDWLYLDSRGHRRAKFIWKNDALSATWIIP